MAGPFGRLCYPLLNAVKNKVPKATYTKNVKASQDVLDNEKRTLGRHLNAEQQLKFAYVTSKKQVSAIARCHYKGKKTGGEGAGKGEEEGNEEEKEEEEEEGVEVEEGEEEEEDDPLGHKTPDWRKWKWQGEIVYSNDLDARTRSGIEDAAKEKKIKCKEHKMVDAFKK
ncbi:unnamed protein product [Prunus armeniaca]